MVQFRVSEFRQCILWGIYILSFMDSERRTMLWRAPELLAGLHGGSLGPARRRSWSAASISTRGEDELGWTDDHLGSCWAWTRRPAACACLFLNPLHNSQQASLDSGAQEHLGIGPQPAIACAPEIRKKKKNITFNLLIFKKNAIFDLTIENCMDFVLCTGNLASSFGVIKLGTLFITWFWILEFSRLTWDAVRTIVHVVWCVICGWSWHVWVSLSYGMCLSIYGIVTRLRISYDFGAKEQYPEFDFRSRSKSKSGSLVGNYCWLKNIFSSSKSVVLAYQNVWIRKIYI